MRRFLPALLLLAACGNPTALVAAPASATKTVEYFVIEGAFVCVDPDAAYQRDVNADGVADESCWWGCAFEESTGLTTAFEVTYFAAAGSTSLDHLAECRSDPP